MASDAVSEQAGGPSRQLLVDHLALGSSKRQDGVALINDHRYPRSIADASNRRGPLALFTAMAYGA